MKKSWLRLFLFSFILFSVFILLASSVNAGTLQVTTEHPFLVNGEWIPASELEIGDVLQTIDGQEVRIKSIVEHSSEDDFSVYNLEASEYSNFVVCGEEDCSNENEVGVVVHNSDKVISFVAKNDVGPNRLSSSEKLRNIREINLEIFRDPSKFDDSANVLSWMRVADDIRVQKIHPALRDTSYVADYQEMINLGYKFFRYPGLAQRTGANGLISSNRLIVTDTLSKVDTLFHEVEHFRFLRSFSRYYLKKEPTLANFEEISDLFFTMKKDLVPMQYSFVHKKFFFEGEPFLGRRKLIKVPLQAANEVNSYRDSWFISVYWGKLVMNEPIDAISAPGTWTLVKKSYDDSLDPFIFIRKAVVLPACPSCSIKVPVGSRFCPFCPGPVSILP